MNVSKKQSRSPTRKNRLLTQLRQYAPYALKNYPIGSPLYRATASLYEDKMRQLERHTQYLLQEAFRRVFEFQMRHVGYEEGAVLKASIEEKLIRYLKSSRSVEDIRRVLHEVLKERMRAVYREGMQAGISVSRDAMGQTKDPRTQVFWASWGAFTAGMYLDTRVKREVDSLLARVARTMGEDLVAYINRARREGHPLDEIIVNVKRITGVTEEWRAKRIARTELSASATNGTMMFARGLDYDKFRIIINPPTACKFCRKITVNGRKVWTQEEIDDYPRKPIVPLHPNCVSDDTEIYTERGWVYAKDVRVGETALSINPETLNLEWLPVTETFEVESPVMVHFKSRYLDHMVTPDHRVFCQTDSDRHTHPRRWGFKKAYEFIGRKSDHLYASSEWVGTDSATKEWAEFLGYYLSEGSVTRHKGHWQVSIAQSRTKNPDKYEKILEFLEGFVGRKIWCADMQMMWVDDILGKQLSIFGKSHEKFVPPEVKSARPEVIRAFLDAFLLGDGTVRKGKVWKGTRFNDQRVYTTSSRRLADDIGELILKTGKRPSFRVHHTTGKMITHRNGRYASKYDITVVSECEARKYSMANTAVHVENYNRKAYCIQLPRNHTFWSRRNGMVVWTGNCYCLLQVYMP